MTWTKTAVALLSALSIAAGSAVAQPARIIVIRHAEKPGDPEDPHLSPAGVQRAQRLVTFITKDPAMVALGSPAAVFASQPTKHGNGQRTRETVAPVASALKLPVQTPYRNKDYAELAKLLLTSPAYKGKTVLVSWTHDEIPKLATALGVTPKPKKWKASDYDQVYVISYQNGKPTLATTHYE